MARLAFCFLVALFLALQSDASFAQDVPQKAEQQAEPKPAEANPADPKPADEKPAEPKVADAKPADAKPAEAKPADAKPTELQAGHSSHGEAFNEGPRQSAYLMGGTGNINFEVSSKVENVQQFINQGLGQVHGFWYFEAERSFRQAAALDPDCAIAYWGMAMANSGNTKRATAFMAEAVKRKDKASRREQLYIDMLDKYLKADPKKNAERATAYMKSLETLYYEFPTDLEAKALLGLELWQGRGKGVAIPSTLSVDALFNEVLLENPLHPVHHYRIHLWDYEKTERALNSAANCGASAPSIAHMWHMSGHIYSRLNRYADAAWQQEASARVDYAHMMRDRVLPDQIHNFAHNNEWLIRDLHNIGAADRALEFSKNMLELPRHPKYNSLQRGSNFYGRMRLFETLDQFEMWNELLELSATPYLEPTSVEAEQVKQQTHVARAFFRSGDLENGKLQLAKLQEKFDLKTAEQTKAEEAAEAKVRAEFKPSPTPAPAPATPAATGTPVVPATPTTPGTPVVPATVTTPAVPATPTPSAPAVVTPAAPATPETKKEEPQPAKTGDVPPAATPTEAAPKNTEAPKPEEPKTDPPKPEEPKTDPPKTDEPKADAPKPEPPKDDAPKPEPPMDDPKLTKDIAAARTVEKNKFSNVVRPLEQAVAEMNGYVAVSEDRFKDALELFKKAPSVSNHYKARITLLNGDKAGAEKLVRDHANSRKNQTLPQAALVEILWKADKKDDARKAFDELRKQSGHLDIKAPVFAALAPIAKEFEYPDDWRLPYEIPKDFGDRPSLDDLGPFRWQPSLAPEFALTNHEGKEVKLSDYRGKKVVLIFYLGFGCLHCAEQLQKFGPKTEDFKKAGFEILAVSSDLASDLTKSVENYCKDAEGKTFPFPLVSNEKLDVFKSFRCHDDFEGKTLHGTFVIDEDGFVRWQDISYAPFMDPDFVLQEGQRLIAQRKADLVVGKE